MKQNKSTQLWNEAQQIFPGGVNSPVRAFKGVGGSPFFVCSGSGPCITDADGNTLIDYVLSWGPLAAVCPSAWLLLSKDAVEGFGYGIPTEGNPACPQGDAALPQHGMIRFVSSGTSHHERHTSPAALPRDLVVRLRVAITLCGQPASCPEQWEWLP